MIVVTLAVLSLVACGVKSGEVRGTILNVDSSSILDLRSLDIRDETGASWHFEARKRFSGFTPSHLRQHMVQGESVAVRYHKEGESLIIDDVTD